MKVSSTKMQNNFGKYLNFAANNEEIVVTKNGRDIAKLVSVPENYSLMEEASDYMAEGDITYEEFLELTENSDQRYELIDGVIYNLASPSYQHQVVVNEIFVHLYNYFKGKKCRPLTSPFDVTLMKSPENINVVQPDIIVMCDTEKVDANGKYRGVPTLVVEVLSPSTKMKDMIKKLSLYTITGIKEYWLVDTQKKEIYVYSFSENDVKDYRVFTNSTVVVSDVFDGLEIKMSDIFESF